jgi:thiamine biosynthesis lipoprotein
VNVSRFEAMGCRVEIGGATGREAAEIRRLFEARDRQFSRFRPESELCRVNESQREVVVVSKSFAQMAERALKAARATRGLVDPTLGAALRSAGYDRDFRALRPTPEAARPGPVGRWREVRVTGRLLIRPVGVELDLNGVVKGQTVDEALDLLSGEGFVSAGGDYAGCGAFDVVLPRGGSVRVTRGGLATSGTTKRRWLRADSWKHHLIDPRTGEPARSPWTEVTVSAATCVQADIAAKAAFLLGDAGPEWLDERQLPGRFLDEHGGELANESWRRALSPELAAA